MGGVLVVENHHMQLVVTLFILHPVGLIYGTVVDQLLLEDHLLARWFIQNNILVAAVAAVVVPELVVVVLDNMCTGPWTSRVVLMSDMGM